MGIGKSVLLPWLGKVRLHILVYTLYTVSYMQEPSGPHRAYYGTPLPLPTNNYENDGDISKTLHVIWHLR